ncbi:MAG TPA: response regulator transcription factor [Ignavibacteria bacterium]|nr:response regulator transcription factor [Ignavibacteria bacterium]HRJ99661.1 response regulator transcription factor [Ignavibacteria bacterium]
MSEIKKIKIIIADDHPIFRSGLKQIIQEDENIEIIGVADNGEKAIQKIEELKPDIALLDIEMPKMTGLQVLKKLRELKIDCKVIFLTVFSSEDIFDESMELGVNGYVLKDCAVDDIIECINKVYQNNYYISPSISNFLISRRDKIKKFEKKNPSLNDLTKTELAILKHISEGKTSKEIAHELFISYKTVENHRSNINAKLNLKGPNSLMKFAFENKSLL